MLDDVLGGLLGAVFGDRLVNRRTRKLALSGKAECGLRVVAGSHAGLTTKWRHGTAQLEPGTIRFERTEIHVRSIDASTKRRPSGRESWSVSPRTEIVRLDVDGATLEWAVLKDRLTWAIERVEGRHTQEER